MNAVTQLSPAVGVLTACEVLGVARASFYRQRLRPTATAALVPKPALPAQRPAPARSLSPEERARVLAVLHEERFQDRSPAAVQATLLDEGQYLCSIRTMYRILEQQGESRERRDQLVHPPYQKPQLLATAPNQLWSWDITKLLGPAKWTYFYLYVILDVFSMSSSMSSAAMSLAGWWRPAKAPNWPSGSSRRRSASITSPPASSTSTPTAVGL